MPPYCQKVEGESKEVEITVGGKKHRVWDVIAFDVSQLPKLPKDVLFGEDLLQILNNGLGGPEKTAVERQQDLATKYQRFSDNLKELAIDFRRGDSKKAEELLKQNEQISGANDPDCHANRES